MIFNSGLFYRHPHPPPSDPCPPRLASASPQIDRERSRERDKDVRRECVRRFWETEEDPLCHSGSALWSNDQEDPRITYCRGSRSCRLPRRDASPQTGKNCCPLRRWFHDAATELTLQDRKQTQAENRQGVYPQVILDKTVAFCREGDKGGRGFPGPPRKSLTSARWMSAKI